MIKTGEANEVIQELCRTEDWRNNRAVLFLDPYGMQVEWTTLEMVAKTEAIDLWYLWPLGMGVNRLLTRSGEIPASWRHRMNVHLGTQDWFEAFYKPSRMTALFGEQETRLVKTGIETIIPYFVNRLKAVFPGVAPNPLVLMNSTNCPLYLFCFAVSNPSPRAQAIALRIANHILSSD